MGGFRGLPPEGGTPYFPRERFGGIFKSLFVLTLFLLLLPTFAFSKTSAPLTFCCQPDNDLYVALVAYKYPRFTNALVAIQRAPKNSGVLILADQYPESPTEVDAAAWGLAGEKGLRLYVEYPARVPGLKAGGARVANWERIVVTSDNFSTNNSSPIPPLQRMQILMAHGCHFLPFTNHVDADLMLARVAGYDKAIYGLPDHDAWPVFFLAHQCKI